jgi:hypothetical protein
MIEHIWTVLCSQSIYDSETNNVTLVGILEQLNFPKDVPFPISLPLQLDLVSLWSRSPKNKPTQGIVRLTFINPSNEKENPITLPIDLSKSERHRSRFRIVGLPIKRAGYHSFIVEFQEKGRSTWERAAQIPLSIKLIDNFQKD